MAVAHAPEVAPPPAIGTPVAPQGATATVVSVVGRSLPLLNRWFMVPLLRLGLGAWLGTPFGGYVLLLRVRGRKSGLVRETPLSYFVADGSAWVMAGFGARTEWYRNLVADPVVEIAMPGRVLHCRAEEATDPGTRARIMPALTRATGLPGAMVGCNPWTAPDARIVALLAGIPLVRLTPFESPLAGGPDDPGGHAWIWRQSLLTVVTVGLLWGGLRAGRHLVPGLR
ncbi:MAG TPA: nitroreductase/quinone reductase family protein [Candidatus Limnocylindrales bacterium]|jgi:deazaflavin-dependent oxidoreductase (nitroreductase family)